MATDTPEREPQDHNVSTTIDLLLSISPEPSTTTAPAAGADAGEVNAGKDTTSTHEPGGNSSSNASPLADAKADSERTPGLNDRDQTTNEQQAPESTDASARFAAEAPNPSQQAPVDGISSGGVDGDEVPSKAPPKLEGDSTDAPAQTTDTDMGIQTPPGEKAAEMASPRSEDVSQPKGTAGATPEPAPVQDRVPVDVDIHTVDVTMEDVDVIRPARPAESGVADDDSASMEDVPMEATVKVLAQYEVIELPDAEPESFQAVSGDDGIQVEEIIFIAQQSNAGLASLSVKEQFSADGAQQSPQHHWQDGDVRPGFPSPNSLGGSQPASDLALQHLAEVSAQSERHVSRQPPSRNDSAATVYAGSQSSPNGTQSGLSFVTLRSSFAQPTFPPGSPPQQQQQPLPPADVGLDHAGNPQHPANWRFSPSYVPAGPNLPYYRHAPPTGPDGLPILAGEQFASHLVVDEMGNPRQDMLPSMVDAISVAAANGALPAGNPNSRRQPKDGVRKSVPRPKSGCYTCRIRRKKCDEKVDEHGSCQTCIRLRLECLGFGRKRPDWLRDAAALNATRERIREFLAAQGLIKGQFGPLVPGSTPARRGGADGAFLALVPDHLRGVPVHEHASPDTNDPRRLTPPEDMYTGPGGAANAQRGAYSDYVDEDVAEAGDDGPPNFYVGHARPPNARSDVITLPPLGPLPPTRDPAYPATAGYQPPQPPPQTSSTYYREPYQPQTSVRRSPPTSYARGPHFAPQSPPKANVKNGKRGANELAVEGGDGSQPPRSLSPVSPVDVAQRPKRKRSTAAKGQAAALPPVPVPAVREDVNMDGSEASDEEGEDGDFVAGRRRAAAPNEPELRRVRARTAV